MHKTLDALSKKIAWQVQDLEQQYGIIDRQLQMIDQQVQNLMKTMREANKLPTHIVPEQEIARLHFVLHQQQHHTSLQDQQQRLTREQQTLKSDLTCLKTTLKMLEKYQRNKENSTLKQHLRHVQDQADEWAMQQGEHA